PPRGPSGEPWLRKHVRHYVSGHPWLYRAAEHHLDALAAVAPDEIRSFRPDLVMVSHEELAPLLHVLPSTVPTLLDLHNVLMQIQWQEARQGGPREWVRTALELGVLAREERRALRAASGTVVVSPQNLRIVKRLDPSGRAAFIPNCIDTSYFRGDGVRADTPVVVMTASYHYPPNQEAVNELI